MTDSLVQREFFGTAAELHALAHPTVEEPTRSGGAELWIMRPSAPALVMGSSQKPEQFDQQRLAADGVQLASRRSGGGAVFIEPSATVWIDLVAPRSSNLWSNELTENFLIVGQAWQRALSSLGIETDLCTESPKRTAASTLACWAGVGWGELTLPPTTAKLVGLSQRRTRWGARVQAMAVLDTSVLRVADYLLAADRRTVRDELVSAAVSVAAIELERAVLASFTE